MYNIKSYIYSLLYKLSRFLKTDIFYLIKQGGAVEISKIVSLILSFLLSIVLANFLSQEEYGTYKYALSIFAYLSIPTLAYGMTTSLSRSIAQNKQPAVLRYITVQLKWSFLSFLASIGLSVYYLIQQNFTLSIVFIASSLLLPVMEIANIYTAIWQGRKDFVSLSKINIVSKTISTIALALAAILSKNALLMILVYLIIFSSIRFYFLVYTLKKHKISISKTVKDEEGISYGKHLSFISILEIISSHIDKILTFHILGPAQLAVYAFAIAIPEQIKSVLKPLDTLAYPKFVERDEEEIKKSLPRKFAQLFALSVIIIAAYWIAAPFIYKIFFPQYTQSIFYSQIFAISMINLTLFPSGTFLRAKKKIKKQYIAGIINPLFNIAITTALIINYGIMGIIIARIITRISSSLFNTYLIYK